MTDRERTRPLTVSDRRPEVGDRIRLTSLHGKMKEYLVEAIRPDIADQFKRRIGLFECSFWYDQDDLRQAVFVSRADGGPVTVTEEAE